MPRLSVWFIRAALVALVTGAAVGSLLLAAKVSPAGGRLAYLVPLHAELLLIGWVVNLAFGVAYWILPKHAAGRERGHPAPAWAAFVLLNSGVAAAAFAAAAAAAPLLLAGRAAQLLALTCFAAHAWSRIKPFGRGRAVQAN